LPPGRRYGLAAIVAVALISRLALALLAPAAPITGDPSVYDELAVSIAHGDGWRTLPREPGGPPGPPTALHPPAWPLVLGATYALTGNAQQVDVAVHVARSPFQRRATRTAAVSRLRAGRVANAVLGALAVALVGLIAAELWGGRAARACALVAAIYPSLPILALTLESETLFVAVVMAAVYALLRLRRSDDCRRWAVAAGAAAGLAVLTRANGAAVLLPLALGAWHRRPRWTARALAAPMAILATAALIVMPWAVRNALVMHSFVPVSTDLGQTLSGTYNPSSAAERYHWRNLHRLPVRYAAAARIPDEARRSWALTRAGLDYVSAHPAAVASASWWNTLRMFEIDRTAHRGLALRLRSRTLARISIAGFIALAALAAGGLVTVRARHTPAFVWATPLMLWASVVPFAVVFGRFRAPLDAFLILLAGLSVTAVRERFGRTGR
jgi:4-amino-4-deoxy-L-arabinose transferase-like glycosyltransferase